jgi:Ca2+-binding EF-hand superfamily protein
MASLVKRGIIFLYLVVISCLNVFAQQNNTPTAQAEFQKIDINKNGYIDSTEMQSYQKQRFSELDKNKDGVIDSEELKADKTKMFEKADENKDGKITQQEAFAQFNKYLNEMDTDKDAKVSEKEYKEYWPVVMEF